MTLKAERGAEDPLGLPRKLGNGLLLRWCTPADVESVATLMAEAFAEDGVTDESIMAEVRDWMSGNHPSFAPEDVTVVIDENKGGKIVSTASLISQVWAYDGVPFKVGQIEDIATDPAYRRMGLVRAQLGILHARSKGRGELMQVISGIPWYYRQFGYEMTIPLEVEQRLDWANVTRLDKDQSETYRLRPATPPDIGLLVQLYAIHCASSLLTMVRNQNDWHYELTTTHPEAESKRHFFIIENKAGDAVGYTELSYYEKSLAVRELAVLPGHPLRLVGEFLTRDLKIRSEKGAKTAKEEEEKKEAFEYASFLLGSNHPGTTALGKQLSEPKINYYWLVRIDNLPAFLMLIAPVLNKRLQASVFDGYTGTLRLNFYTSHLRMEFKSGKLTEVGTYTPEEIEDGDAAFLGLTFLQLLMGYRSLAELQQAFPECVIKNERTATLLEAIFPKIFSVVVGID